MKTIYKYDLPIGSHGCYIEHDIPDPACHWLDIGLDLEGKPVVWCEVDTDEDSIRWAIYCQWTGMSIAGPSEFGLYLGTMKFEYKVGLTLIYHFYAYPIS